VKQAATRMTTLSKFYKPNTRSHIAENIGAFYGDHKTLEWFKLMMTGAWRDIWYSHQ